MAWRPLQAFEGHFEHETLILVRGDGPDGTEAVTRVVAHIFVEQRQLLVRETKVRLTDRRQLLALLRRAPDTECEIGNFRCIGFYL